MKTFDQPQRQSPFALVMMFFNIFRVVVGQVWPALLALFLGKKENMGAKWLILGGGVVLFVLIRTVLDYWYFTFYISGGQLIIRKGFFTRKKITIPIERIQAIHLEQSLLHRLTGTYKVLIDTAGAEKEEVKIFAILSSDAIALRQILLTEPQLIENQTPVTRSGGKKLISKLNIQGLLKLSLSANHLETIALIGVFVIGKFDDIKPLINKIPLLKRLESYGEAVQFTWTFIATLAVFILLITIAISVIRTCLKFYGYTVFMDEKGFHIRWGLLQIKQKMVPFTKIQMVTWKSNFIRRLIGLALLNLKVAGAREEKVKMRIELPITNQEQIEQLIHAYQPLLPSIEQGDGFKIHSSFFIRKAFFITLPILLVVSGLLSLKWGWVGLWVLALWPLSIIKNWWYWTRFRFWISDTGLQRYASSFGKNEILLNWNNIQYVQLRQSLYQKRKGLSTLFLHTAGGKFELPFIQYEQGLQISNFALFRAESTQQNWM